MRNYLLLLFVLPMIAGLLQSCGKESTNSELPVDRPAVAPDVLASYDGGQITQADFDRAFAQLPSQAKTPNGDRVWWTERIVRQIFANRIYLEEIKAGDFSLDPDRLAVRRNLHRLHYSDHYLFVEQGYQPNVSEEALVEFYERNQHQFSQSESRALYHIFKRATTAEEIASAESELSELARRVNNGENFGLLAEKYSESESRHRKGSMGVVGRGILQTEAEAIVFALDEGKVSDPVRTAGGVHIFYNENTVQAREFPIEELTPMMRRVLILNNVRAKLAEIAGSMEIPVDHSIPAEAEVTKMIVGGDPESVLLSVGSFELKLDAFSRIVSAQQQTDAFLRLLDAPILGIYNELKDREIIYQSMLAARVDDESEYAEIEASFRAKWDAALLNSFQEEKLKLFLNDQENWISEHYEANRNRFLSQPRVHLRVLSIPLGPDASEKMTELESAHKDLTAGTTSLESLASDLGGSIEDFGWLTPMQLRLRDPRASLTAYAMEAGSFSFPYLLGQKLRLYEVVQQEAPTELPLVGVRERVVAHYLTSYRQKVFEAMLKEMMSARNFSFYPENVQQR